MINHENDQRSLVFFRATSVVSAGVSVVVTEWFMTITYMFMITIVKTHNHL